MLWFIAADKALFFYQKVLIVFLFICVKVCCGTHEKHLIEALLMSTHIKPFHGEIRKICGYSSELE